MIDYVAAFKSDPSVLESDSDNTSYQTPYNFAMKYVSPRLLRSKYSPDTFFFMYDWRALRNDASLVLSDKQDAMDSCYGVEIDSIYSPRDQQTILSAKKRSGDDKNIGTMNVQPVLCMNERFFRAFFRAMTSITTDYKADPMRFYLVESERNHIAIINESTKSNLGVIQPFDISTIGHPIALNGLWKYLNK